AGPYEAIDRPGDLASIRVVDMCLSEREHGAADPIECDETAAARSTVAHRRDRGDEPVPNVRQRRNLPADVHGLRDGPGGEIEVHERLIAHPPSRLAVQRDPEPAQAGSDRTGMPRHGEDRCDVARRRLLAVTARRK